METSVISLTTDDWTKVTDDGEDFSIQNISNGNVELAYKGASPLPVDTKAYYGIVVQKFHGITSAVFGQGEVWARGLNDRIIVTK